MLWHINHFSWSTVHGYFFHLYLIEVDSQCIWIYFIVIEFNKESKIPNSRPIPSCNRSSFPNPKYQSFTTTSTFPSTLTCQQSLLLAPPPDNDAGGLLLAPNANVGGVCAMAGVCCCDATAGCDIWEDAPKANNDVCVTAGCCAAVEGAALAVVDPNENVAWELQLVWRYLNLWVP